MTYGGGRLAMSPLTQRLLLNSLTVLILVDIRKQNILYATFTLSPRRFMELLLAKTAILLKHEPPTARGESHSRSRTRSKSTSLR